MMHISKRLLIEFKTRGGSGFVRFLALRIVQWRVDVLYETDLRIYVANPPVAPAVPVVLVWRHNLGSEATAQVEAAVLTPENHAYREALRGDDHLLAALNSQGEVTSYGFVLFESFYKRILTETPSTPMIGNCFTLPVWRGLGFYPCLLVATCQHLAAQGYRRAVITCAPNNLASVRGIEKAGFKRVRTVRSLVILTRWIAWQRNIAPEAAGRL